MASQDEGSHRLQAIRRAIKLTTTAMDLLDAHRGPPDAAAHLDLALQKMREALAHGT